MNKNKFIALLLVTEMLINIISISSLTVSAETFNINRSISYTSSTSITIEQSGYYYIEAWGGNGGNGGSTSGIINASGIGKGGESQKSEGYFYLPYGTTVYIQVGSAGKNGGDATAGTGGAGGGSTGAPYFGSGLPGGKGGNRNTIFNSDGGGGGAGGSASGILINGTGNANIALASGGGGGGGGGTGSGSLGTDGENGGNGDVQYPPKQYGNNSGGQGQGWSADNTNGFMQYSITGTNGTSGNGAGGGGGGGGGGGFDGNEGGGGGSGGGGSNSPQSGGGGAGGKNYSAGITLPDYIAPLNTNNNRTTGAEGQVYITFLGLAEYTVEFKANGSESIPPNQTVKFNDHAIEPPTPVLAGYTFEGWYKDSSFANLWDFNIDTVTEDIILYAKWEKKTAEIEYRAEAGGSVNIDYETFNPEIEIPKGSTAMPKNGYRFAGWYYSDGLSEEPIYGAGETLIAGDLKKDDDGLYKTAAYIAKFEPVDYNVSYIWFGDIPYNAILPVDDGTYHINDVVKVAEVPGFPGYNFNGWLWGGNIYSEYDFFQMPDEDVEFEGFWTENNSYSVIYDTNGGAPKLDAIMDAAWTQSGLIPAEPPVKPGYDFAGWNVILGGNKTDVKNTDKYSDLADNDGTMEIILQAQWNPKKYTVNFDSNGGSDVGSQTIEYGTFAAEPDVPIKTGYIFKGWYKDNSLDNLWDFNADTITEDITFYAQWEKLTYKVEFVDGLGSTLSIQYVRYGDSAAEPPVPTRENYKFNGWIPASFSNITSDSIFTAQWTENISETTNNITSTGETKPNINNPFNPNAPEESANQINPAKPTGSGGIDAMPATENFTSSGYNNMVSQTDLSVTGTEIVVLPEGIEAIEYENTEDLMENALPLENGWVAVDLSNDWWEVFDDFGIPLGMVNLPDDTDINDLDIEFIETNLISLTNIVTAEEAAKNEPVSKLPEENPQTGDDACAIFGLLALAAIIFGKKRRRNSIS